MVDFDSQFFSIANPGLIRLRRLTTLAATAGSSWEGAGTWHLPLLSADSAAVLSCLSVELLESVHVHKHVVLQ